MHAENGGIARLQRVLPECKQIMQFFTFSYFTNTNLIAGSFMVITRNIINKRDKQRQR